MLAWMMFHFKFASPSIKTICTYNLFVLSQGNKNKSWVDFIFTIYFFSFATSKFKLEAQITVSCCCIHTLSLFWCKETGENVIHSCFVILYVAKYNVNMNWTFYVANIISNSLIALRHEGSNELNYSYLWDTLFCDLSDTLGIFGFILWIRSVAVCFNIPSILFWLLVTFNITYLLVVA